MLTSGLFTGIGGFELGFERAGHRTILLCENDEHASRVLRHRWPEIPLCPDVATLEYLPNDTDVVTAGFPCQNLSMAGDKAGINGRKSTIVNTLFDLLDRRAVPWVVIENVYFMLHLSRGAAIASILDRLERCGYRWAYRVVNSRAFGLPQRRRRVFIVASLSSDPRGVLLADDAPDRKWPEIDMSRPVGFYWTEGRTGNGLTSDAVPPLKGGIGIGHPVSTGGAVAIRPGRHADDRSGGTFPGIPRWLDFGVAGKSRQTASLEASWKCGVRTRGGMDRQSIVCAGALRREPRSATRFDEILACRGVERGRPQNGFWRIGISTVSAPRPSFRICYRKLAQLVGKSVERIHHEGS